MRWRGRPPSTSSRRFARAGCPAGRTHGRAHWHLARHPPGAVGRLLAELFSAFGSFLGGSLRAEITLVVARVGWFVLLFVGGIVVSVNKRSRRVRRPYSPCGRNGSADICRVTRARPRACRLGLKVAVCPM